MKTIVKSAVVFIVGMGLWAGAPAAAEYRPNYCATDHDHRSHDASYYDYYPADQYSRRGDYRSRSDYRDRGRYRDRRGRYNDYDRRRPRSRVVHRENYSTRYRARITLVEEIYWTRSGREQLVCSIVVKGPEAYYVPERRLRRIARRDCSPRARVQYL